MIKSMVKLAHNVHKRQKNHIMFFFTHHLDNVMGRNGINKLPNVTACGMVESLPLHVILYNVV